MSRRASKHPTDRELEILAILWEQGPSGLAEIRAALQRDRPVAATTVATVLQVMLEKKLVRRAGGGKSGGGAYRWSAAVSRKSAARGMVGKVLDRVFDGSASRLVAHLIEEGQLNEKEIGQLKKLLQAEKSKPHRGSGGKP
jgi:predicted transcriptional regulator